MNIFDLFGKIFSFEDTNGLILRGIGFVFFLFFLVIFLTEFLKYLKHGVHDESLDFSFMGMVTFATLMISTDILMAILVGIFVMALMESWMIREYPVWNKLIVITTVFYGIILGSYILADIYDDNRIFGIGLSISFWVMLILGFLLFGKKYILTSRFLSPQYLYLFLYLIAYIIVWRFISLGHIYESLFIVNFLIYLASGPALRVLMGIKPLEDERIKTILQEVKEKMGVKSNIKLGIVHAPILNAFAYGAFFDKRMALVCNDPSEFPDEEWRGVLAHEMAHLKENHVLLLLFVIGAELWFRKIFSIPATFYDYAFAQQTMSFLTFYLIGVVLGVIIFVFMRTMEGRADRAVKNVGYGPQLAKALYTLEGFYTGIGGAAGISVKLLSEEEFTEDEYQIAMFSAAKSLRNFLIKPSKSRAAIDIFMSHPYSALRIAAMVDESLSPTKCALLPWALVVGKGRKGLRNYVEKVEELLNEKYMEKFGQDGIHKLVEIAGLREQYELEHINGEYVGIPFSPLVGSVIVGKIVGIREGNSIFSPLLFDVEVKDEGGESREEIRVVNPMDYRFEIYEVGKKYLLPNGLMGTLRGYEVKINGEKMKIFFKFDVGGNLVITKGVGIMIEKLKALDGKKVLFLEGEKTKLARLNLTLGDSLEETILTLKDERNGDEKKYAGSELIMNLNPFTIGINTKNLEEGEELISWIAKEVKVLVWLFDKKNPETGYPCRIISINRDKKTVRIKKGSISQEISLKEIDAIEFSYPTIELIPKNQVGLGSKLFLKSSHKKKTGRVINL